MFVISKLKKIIPITLILTLLMSTVAFAATDSNKNENRGDFSKERTKISERVKFEGERSGLQTQATEEIREKCDELKAKLSSGEITREQFCEEMKEINPNRMKSNQDRWQNKKGDVPEDFKDKLGELRTKLQDGEVNQEQFRENIKQLRQ
ncbi:hypothetical protein [Candidatus Syntrophocurvum alkaliphilum]|uniref:hypothetical protein n=1 Tax=Candidatus Syntrophocurvum alkaliphilum TaxID=2293317 RepID=UPI0018CED6B7|nr:hypothetical protein [Candidatus Syntrophocurvum alkaliphilum]